LFPFIDVVNQPEPRLMQKLTAFKLHPSLYNVTDMLSGLSLHIFCYCRKSLWL